MKVVWTLLILSAGCFAGDERPIPENFGQCTAEEVPVSESVAKAPTYYQHVKPILDARCAGCHQEGGIGPFPLQSYNQTLPFLESVRTAVATNSMPPWQPEDCCQNYLWDRSLSDDEKELVMRWVDQGAQPGDPANEGPPVEDRSGGLSRVDLRLTMPEPYEPVPQIGADEVRCFLLDWPVDQDTFVTGLNVVPGDTSLVHHVVVYAFDGKDADGLRARSGKDGRAGWDCWGDLAGDSKPIGALGGWAPGYRGVEYPDHLGRKVPKDSVIVLNVHYDAGRGIREDQTSVELMLDDDVAGEMKSVGIVNPLWLVGDGMKIAKDDPDASTFFSYDPTTVLSKGKAFSIYSVNHHMHELGTIGRMAILRKDGSTECLLNIQAWDFDWLGEYYFDKPIRFEPGDELYVECHWDNRSSNQKIVNGEQIPSSDIAWGTDKEMCAGVMNVLVDQ